MNVRKVNAAKLIYEKNFASEMSPEAVEVAQKIETHSELEEHEDILSAGEFDCISWVLGS